VIILHEDPLYMTARYLGIPPRDIHPEITARAAKLAEQHDW
jgi:hypothetical protein